MDDCAGHNIPQIQGINSLNTTLGRKVKSIYIYCMHMPQISSTKFNNSGHIIQLYVYFHFMHLNLGVSITQSFVVKDISSYLEFRAHNNKSKRISWYYKDAHSISQ